MKKFFEELSRRLREGGVESSNVEDRRLEIFLHGQPVLFVSPGNDVFLFPAGSNNPEASELYHRVAQTADEVYTYVEEVQTAPTLHISGLSEKFHLLADFGGAVLAGRELENGRGYQFVTWIWDYNRTGVSYGHYYDGSSIVGLSQKELEKQAFFDLVQLFFHFTTLTKERMWNMGNLIAVTNFKGGVGKTTTTLNLGAALSAAGKRVLLVDNDPQGNLTAALGYTPPEQKHTLATLLLAAIDYPEDLDIHIGRAILHSETGVDLIGANRRLADAAARLQIMQMSQYNAVGDAECSCETVMATLLLPLRSAYDYIIIDCGLKHELLTVNALTAADYCIIPVQSHFLASEGIPDVLDMVRSVQAKFNPQLKIAGILLTMYQSRPQLCQSVRSGVSEVYGEQFHVFERPIEYSIKVAECPAAGQSILSYAPKNAAAESYRSLAREVLHLG